MSLRTSVSTYGLLFFFQKYIFVKAKVPEDEAEKMLFTVKLTDIGISLRQYIGAFNEPEILPDKT